ncbi:YceI family protein [Spirosoma pollinicola]|uniref:Polyisoprenoid-binding protein n=1 Tax=Spirosoma pollinicola TaxID=2057025 RepID=A0A2K8YTE7_9BACT|nr:YceI family protein [Spirosoma pollinicola]AUD00901.1 polyisoprenoid-binding protein [Spirosoma pollinicola]
MKTLFVAIVSLFTLSATYAQTWSVDKAHSRVGFTLTHNLLSDVDGNFKTFDAKITSSKADLSDAVFELSADVNSINTDNERRDGHLKSPDFFDAAKFPALTFKSTSFKKVEGKQYKLVGDLTMHGVTKPVTLNVVMAGPVAMKGMGGKEQEKAGFKASGTIKRSDFSVGTIPVVVVSDEIELKVNGEFTRQDAALAEKK